MNFKNLNTYKLNYLSAVGIFLLIILITQVASLPFILLKHFYPLPESALMALNFGLGFGSAVIIVSAILGLSFNQLFGFFAKPKYLKYFIWAIIIYLFSLPISEYLANLVPTDSPEYLAELYQEMEEIFTTILKDPIPAFISVSILAPLLEELIFRGLLLRGLLNARQNPYISIILTSLLFGLAHGNPWQFLAAGFLGAILGFIYWRTQDLWICIFIHFLNNTISLVFVSILGNDASENIFEPNFILISFSVICVAVALYLFHQKTEKLLKNR
uniref:CPBP family intramembrane glutamic endopeptidase n=1 Tax=Ornithobacterium rhinotracheale TaxID=28251 RepID=UPI0039A415AF